MVVDSDEQVLSHCSHASNGIDRAAITYGYDAGAGTSYGAADNDDHPPLPPRTPMLAVTICDNIVTAYD